MKSDDDVHIGQITEAIRQIIAYLREASIEDFARNNMLQDAILHQLEIAGRASRDLSLQFRQEHQRVACGQLFGIEDGVRTDVVNTEKPIDPSRSLADVESHHTKHSDMLEQGVEAWNEWRKQDRAVVPDLDGVNLQKAPLSSANLTRANLRDALLIEANLRDTDLTGANLSGANLSEADLTGASLSKADLTGASLSEADLTGASLSEADLTGANLSGANLYQTSLGRANLSKANLREADLTDAHVREANFTGANLTEANLSKADLIRANLTEANLSKANLTEANFIMATLTGANLREANLEGALNLTAAQLGETKTLYMAALPPDLLKDVMKRYPHRLKEPPPEAQSGE